MILQVFSAAEKGQTFGALHIFLLVQASHMPVHMRFTSSGVIAMGTCHPIAFSCVDFLCVLSEAFCKQFNIV